MLVNSTDINGEWKFGRGPQKRSAMSTTKLTCEETLGMLGGVSESTKKIGGNLTGSKCAVEMPKLVGNRWHVSKSTGQGRRGVP